MKTIIKLLLVLAFSMLSWPVSAALRVFACEPEWAALAQELAGDRVSVYSATTAMQDADRIEARPSLIARVRSADLLICTGSQMEIGWLPLLLTQSGNGRIQPGSPGYFEASRFVAKLEVPSVVDRSLGDIHPAGNPHIHTDPRNIAKVAEALTQRLAQIDPENADAYRARGKSFLERWRSAIEKWERQAAPLKGMPIVEHHRAFVYLVAWLGLKEVGTLEPIPGIPPTPSHLAGLVEAMRRQPAKAIVYSTYNDPKAAAFLSERTKIPAVMLPYSVGGTDKAKDLYGFFDDLIGRLLGVVK
ncbi:MAG: zinc ABC transporter substrate-binding protein [Betaproteobacteria bacterium RBG_16_64_18]|nr:MAG: zinc ABC transporter substrate-binding protein [Betaproteobacteria bacterium RBG_16_64_18]OGA10415.1 MAG: zinc ABC transporter substrate-binding protein [Betaproteobacteria bacterium RIFCSPLOWO2_02_FULL_65_20]OGA40229.1 MAG: zinc ABC transporter substrate-binding protein [Betaproteobacteria bacterium RIFCSPLOWO2_12_FULL_65_110]